MRTLKRFIRYYRPYRAVFFLDLICAAFISLVDLCYPQILRTLTGGSMLSPNSPHFNQYPFHRRWPGHFKSSPPHWNWTAFHVSASKPV